MLNLKGERFGRLVVVRRVPGGAWMCKCDCGGVSFVTTSNLRSDNSHSCGCALDEARRTHGLTGTPEYMVWKAMRSRCNTKGDHAYRNYGGRGISVCEEWSDFVTFLTDMGTRPTPRHELDRVDNDKGYSKDNCRWITHRQNLNNKRTNRIVTYLGRSMIIAEWAEEIGVNYRTLNNRINRGWSTERALTEPISK
jgi:hypothetical protein